MLINAAFLLGFYIRFEGLEAYFDNQYLSFQLFFNLAWGICTYFLKTYEPYRLQGYLRIFSNLIQLLLLHLLFVVAFNGLIKTYYSRLFILYTYAAILVLFPIWRFVLAYFLKLYQKKGLNVRKVVIAGLGDVSEQMRLFFKEHPEHGYKFLGFFDDKTANNNQVKGKINQLKKFVLENQVDEIFVALAEIENEKIKDLIDFADNNLVRIKLLPESKGFQYKKIKVDFYDHLPVLSLRTLPLDNLFNRFVKRLFDLIFSSLVILFILSWFLPILAILIKLDSKGPVFFKQKRSGKKNAYFWCYKLRSMKVNQEANSQQAQRNDSRITKLGKNLRKYNLDELPQFFNVLIGDMSVVGPRPHMIKHTEDYAKIIDKYMLRHFVKPGITGLSQVKGYRGETQNPQQMKNRIKVDIFYMENWSFLLDLKVIFLTVYNMIKGDKQAF